jgi:hypothetical protein
MAGEMEVLFSLAGRVHTLLRRENSRIIDIEWLCEDGTYAREILRLLDATASDELHKLADRIREVHPALLTTETKSAPASGLFERKYTTSLR